jgi:carboxypeptidase C (cathepsin A)
MDEEHRSAGGEMRAPILFTSPALLAILLAWDPCQSLALYPSEAAPESTSKDKKEGKDAKKGEDKKYPDPSTTNHSVTIDGKAVCYTATAGTLPIKKEDGKETAAIFHIAYTSGGAEGHSKRPITFSFNGGPGSSSVWLHLGILGPKRVKLDSFGRQPSPPFSLVENEFSLLDKTDLVFIDPVSTGYSRVSDDGKAKDFHGVEQDVESVGEFIRLYLTRNNRWDSPIFLIGESYGTTRATALSEHLQQKHGIYLNGILLVSSVLQFQTLRFNDGNDLPYILFLPSYTASAWYHKKLPAPLQSLPLREAVKKAEEFAVTKYPEALLRGTSMPEPQRRQTAAELAKLTGLDEEWVMKAGLRIDAFRFFKELLRDEGLTIGRFDARYTGMDRDPLGNFPDYDPSYSDIIGAFTSTLNIYLREELLYETDLPYKILSGDVHPWDYGRFTNRYLETAERLRSAMAKNPHMGVHVSSGYYDLATPYFATEYTLGNMGLHPSQRERITVDYYEGGHMMYLVPSELLKQRRDFVRFYDSILQPNP